MKILSKILRFRKKIIFKKRATLLGNNYIFGPAAGISLADGSTKDDIILEDHVWVHCSLASQNHGKIYMGKYTKIGTGSRISCVNSVYIGDYTAIADNTVISDNNNHPLNPDFRLYMRQQSASDDSRKWRHSSNEPIVIGKNCWIGQNVRIQKGVTIGDNCIIGANSVVTKSVPSNCIAGGNPAKILKTDIDKIAPPTTCKGYNEHIKKQ